VEGSTTDLDEAALMHALSVNLLGPWRLIKAAAPWLRRSRGSIVNIASIEGLAAAPNHLAYGVSKAGLIGLTRSVAIDLAPEVRCNTVCPGTILTPMSETFLDRMPDPQAARELLAGKTMVGRLGTPDDIADVVRFLLSSESAFVNATTLVADGGRMARVP
jgi:meso-butanediol dehydrogenase/(S,S)-butanediol dehydrogenase/diacetyl reductase